MTHLNLFADEVYIDLNMFSSLMLNLVGGEIYVTDIVAVDYCGPGYMDLHFKQKVAQPRSFGHDVSDASILSFSPGPGDCLLAFLRPGDEVLSEEDAITGGGATSGGTTCPISI